MESNHIHMDSLLKPFMHFVLALLVGVGLSITLLAQTISLVVCNSLPPVPGLVLVLIFDSHLMS